MVLAGKKVLVVGMGASGAAAARLCLARGAEVRFTDKATAPPAAAGLAELGATPRLGGHDPADFPWAELIVLSPGVDHRLPEVVAAARNGAEVIGEMELGFRFLRPPAVMITGTNGKSTVTSLIAAMLEAAGLRAFAGGNLGTPLCAYVASAQDDDWAVLEVSSFQTDTAVSLRPKVGVILNITDDHLDRYDSFAQYAASKFRLLANQAGGDVAVLCADDPEVAARLNLAPAGVWLYGAANDHRPGGRLEGQRLALELPGRRLIKLDASRSRLWGGFNQLNILAAGLAAAACGVSAQAMQRAIDEFQPLGHRLALVAERDGVAWYDDSKGTNVGAVQAALEALARPAVLLLGGRDKDGRFALLAPQLKAWARQVICFGEAGASIASQIEGLAERQVVADLPAAVALAAQEAKPGDAVLLSPGCASFDAYAGYAMRGDHFRRLVAELN